MSNLVQSYTLMLVKDKSVDYSTYGQVTSPQLFINVVNEMYGMDSRAEECVVIMALDVRKNPIGVFFVSQGSLTSSVVHPREVFKRLLLNNAESFIVGHNHPSGDVAPSNNDLNIMERLSEVGKLVGIELVDFLIIGNGNYYSHKESGGIM